MERGYAIRGRGARSNQVGRFDALARENFEDGWDSRADFPREIRTWLMPETVRTLIGKNDSPDIPFEQSINPYRGCEHGCAYCYARPAHAYVGLSPGLDFETRIFYKTNAAAALERQLRSPRYVPRRLAIGANTDPYQPAERRHRITRQILQVLLKHRHPVSIITRSALILRDRDLLAELAARRLLHISVSVTTLSNKIARCLEPRASAPARRLQAIADLSAAGIPVTLMFAPVIPGLTDEELERVLAAGASAGARRAGYVLLRLPREVRELFRESLAAHFPERVERVFHLLRSMRAGKDYDARFGVRMRGTGTNAQLIQKRFELAVRANGLSGSLPALNYADFQHRPEQGRQLILPGTA